MYYISDYYNKEVNVMEFVKNKLEENFRKKLLSSLKEQEKEVDNKDCILKVDIMKEVEELRKKLLSSSKEQEKEVDNKDCILKVDTVKEAEELRKKLKF